MAKDKDLDSLIEDLKSPPVKAESSRSFFSFNFNTILNLVLAGVLVFVLWGPSNDVTPDPDPPAPPPIVDTTVIDLTFESARKQSEYAGRCYEEVAKAVEAGEIKNPEQLKTVLQKLLQQAKQTSMQKLDALDTEKIGNADTWKEDLNSVVQYLKAKAKGYKKAGSL